MYGEVIRRYFPAMSTSSSPEPEYGTSDRDALVAARNAILNEALGPISPGVPSSRRALGTLRIEIHGSWSVADLITLLGRLEDGYKAAAALESLADQPSGSTLS